MVCGFLGAVIGLERAVALGKGWAYLAPALAGLGTVLLLVGMAPTSSHLMALSALVLTAASIFVIKLQPLPFTVTMGLGAVAWLGGNVLWLAGRPIPEVVLWWVGFPALTIAGERLQLSRIFGDSALRQRSFMAVIAVLLVGMILSTELGDAEFADLGWRVSGIGLLALAAWLLLFDIARRSLGEPGLRRFIGVCLLSGYAWLAVAGAFALVIGPMAAGPRYDGFLHAFFLGFVFAMIFGHAPIVVPSITGKELPFNNVFYSHLLLLNASLILRIAGDLGNWPGARRWGALLNVVALLLFVFNQVRAVIAARRAPA
jgi:hypothetical protein